MADDPYIIKHDNKTLICNDKGLQEIRDLGIDPKEVYREHTDLVTGDIGYFSGNEMGEELKRKLDEQAEKLKPFSGGELLDCNTVIVDDNDMNLIEISKEVIK